MNQFNYRIVAVSAVDEIRPLWEKLRLYHAHLSWPFADHVREANFESRKRELLEKSAGGAIHIELVGAETQADGIAYCVTTCTSERRGEIDSVFVDAPWRGHGIGSELVRRAVKWLDDVEAKSKTVAVAEPNRDAIRLYSRFGFSPRTILLQQTLER